MKSLSANLRAVLSSLVALIFMLGLGYFAWTYFGVPEEYKDQTIIGVSVFTMVVIAVLVYQSRKVYESARAIARGMTRSMLEESHELFSELYRNSPIPYLVVDSRGIVDSMNVASARFFHVELNALEGIDIFSFIEAEDDNDKASRIPDFYKQEKNVNEVVTQMRRPDGVCRYVLLSLYPFRDGDGRKRGLLTLVDITKQRKIDKAKTEFVSLASHQLRTPISSMKWNLELLETAMKDSLDENQQQYIEKMNHSIERMDMLVADFLNVSKLELGTLKPEYTQVDLVAFVTSITDEYQSPAKKKNVRIDVNWSEISGIVITDAHLLHMIVSNLIGNAVKYTPENGIVRVEARYDIDHVIFTITDNGIGIPEDEQEMIFTKLYRASNAKSEVIEGTGLGLYVVKEAVQVLGGKINFTSNPGKGTTFTVVLPK